MMEMLDKIADYVADGSHGHFLQLIAQAWLEADRDTKKLLKPVWSKLILKHELLSAYALK